MNLDEVVTRAKVPARFAVNGSYGIAMAEGPIMIDNTPITGFKISVNGSFDTPSSSDLIDPRGFKIRLTDPQLLQLMACVSVKNGEITNECVWSFTTPLQARLLPTDSIIHQIITNPCKVTPRNLKRGDVVKIIGTTGDMIYLGKYAAVKTNSGYRLNSLLLSDAYHHAFKPVDGGTVLIKQSPSIFSLVDHVSGYDDVAAEYVNGQLARSDLYYGYGSVVRVLDNKKGVEVVRADKVEVEYDDISAIMARYMCDIGCSFTLDNGKVVDIKSAYAYSRKDLLDIAIRQGKANSTNSVVKATFSYFNLKYSDGRTEVV